MTVVEFMHSQVALADMPTTSEQRVVPNLQADVQVPIKISSDNDGDDGDDGDDGGDEGEEDMHEHNLQTEDDDADSDFYDSDYSMPNDPNDDDNDDDLFESHVDKDIEWVGVSRDTRNN